VLFSVHLPGELSRVHHRAKELLSRVHVGELLFVQILIPRIADARQRRNEFVACPSRRGVA